MLRYGVVRKLFILLSLLLLNTANAAPTGYPDVPHFGYQNHYQAMLNLFDGQVDVAIKYPGVADTQSKEIYLVKHAEKIWFVKILAMNLDNPSPTHYEFEWELKAMLANKNPLAEVGGEIVFPDRAAFFTNKMQQYYIASYPLVMGKTMRYYAQNYILSGKPSDLGILANAVYRYAQVSARLHFDPNDPPKRGEDILERPVQFFLEDRNSANEIYDPTTNKIYLIDYPLLHKHHNKSIPVKNYLLSAIAVAVEGIVNDGSNLEFLINTFVLGYLSALPKYDSTYLQDMLHEYLDSIIQPLIQAKVIIHEFKE